MITHPLTIFFGDFVRVRETGEQGRVEWLFRNGNNSPSAVVLDSVSGRPIVAPLDRLELVQKRRVTR